jgi:hypothetical protein
MSSSQYLRAVPPSVLPVHEEHAPCSCDFATSPSGQAYNEEAFGYFLALERKRAERTRRPLLLLLVDVKGDQPAAGSRIDTELAEQLFATLVVCLRETDFVGWYREGRVAGAVLMQHADMPTAEASQQVSDRVVRTIGERLPEASDRLQVRVYELPFKAKDSR